MLKRICLAAAVLLGLGDLANGLFMLASPAAWYFAVPGVTTTGSFNQHFLRDIGIIFLFLGAAYLIGAARSEYRIVLWGAATLGCAVTPCSTSGKWRSAFAVPRLFLAISRRLRSRL